MSNKTIEEHSKKVTVTEYCYYCHCEYATEDGLPAECNGDCGENPHEFEDNSDVPKELRF